MEIQTADGCNCTSLPMKCIITFMLPEFQASSILYCFNCPPMSQTATHDGEVEMADQLLIELLLF